VERRGQWQGNKASKCYEQMKKATFMIENSVLFVKHPIGIDWPIILEDLKNCCMMKN